MKTVRMAAVLAVAVTGIALAGCQDEAGYRAESGLAVTDLDGYELQGDPKSTIEYSGNKLIFFGEVVGQRPPRKADRATPDGDRVAYVYTPITVKVDLVFKGDRGIIGREVAIRVIGGRVGKEKTVTHLNPEPAAYRPGLKLFLFTQDFVDVGDGLSAATPNFSYAVDGAGNAYNMLNPDLKTGKDNFASLITEWVGFNS
jgi:hypothetical protein